MDLSQFGLFALAVLVLNLTPGPDMLFSIANGVQYGRKAAVIAATGIGLGAVFHSALVAFGVAAIVMASDGAFDGLRIAGALYLMWLGLRSFRNPKADDPVRVQRALTYRGLFLRGLLNNLLNPKVVLFFVALLPQFVDPMAENLAIWLFSMGCFVGVSGTIINGGAALLVISAGSRMIRNSRLRQWGHRVAGFLYIGLGIRLFLVSRS